MKAASIAWLAWLAWSAESFVSPSRRRALPGALGAASGGKRVVEVVEELGGRVTAGDVAGAGAASLASAERELLGLAARLGSEASLEATEDGGLVFKFPRNTKRALASVDSKEKWLQRWEGAKPAVYTAGRAAFGLSLFVSLAVGAALVSTISAASRDDDGRDDRRAAAPRMYFGPSIWGPSPFDIFYYRPYYGYGPPQRREEMGLLQAVFSYVFGDGDPNRDVDSRQVAAAAEIIRRNEGAVVAEQLAPVLAAPPTFDVDDDAVVVDESWVLPVVSELDGRATVDAETGAIVYVFDELTSSGLRLPPGAAAYDPREALTGAEGGAAALAEYDVDFSRASKGQLLTAGALGVANLALAGAATLYSTIWLTPTIAANLGAAGLASVRAIAGPLLAYAISFNAIPFFRSKRLKKKNAGVDLRNANRARWADLARRPSAALRAKLAAAKRLRPSLRRGNAAVAYSSDADIDDVKADKARSDLDDFDALLRE